MLTKFRIPLAAGALLGLMQGAFAQDARPAAPPRGGIVVELNKLEPAGGACRSYFIVTNGSPEAPKELRLTVYLFDKTGVILRSMSLTFNDIRGERSKIVLFELPETNCADLGRLVVNEVTSCTTPAGAPLANCTGLLAARTRAPVEFAY